MERNDVLAIVAAAVALVAAFFLARMVIRKVADNPGGARDAAAIGGMVAISAMLIVGVPCCGAYQEAATYERLTGKHVTWWDAMWVDLRVQDRAK